MSRVWRWIAPAAVAGGLAAGLIAVPAAEAGTAASSIITIKATSPNYPGLKAKDHGQVDKYALVIYRDGAAASAVISGTATTTVTTDTATLMTKSFGQTKYKAASSPEPLTTIGVSTYSFNVTPSLATNYEVQVTGTDSATSLPVTVYVTAGGSTPKRYVREKCTRTRCVLSFREYTTLPASAYKTESGKRVYLYLAIADPRPPKDYTLSKASHASKATRVKAGEFWKTLTFIVPLNARATGFVPTACTKDTEIKDGMGLPHHHGCGDKHVSRSLIYLG